MEATVNLLDHALSVFETIILDYGWQIAVIILLVIIVLAWVLGRIQYETAQRIEAKTISQAVASQARQIEGFTSTSNEMKQELLRVNNELKRYVQENGSQLQRISQLEHQLSDLTLEVERLKILRDDLQLRYNDLLKVNIELEKQLVNVNAVNAELRRKLDVTQNELVLCQRRLSQMDTDTESLTPPVYKSFIVAYNVAGNVTL